MNDINNTNYIGEEQYLKLNKKFKKIGFILLIAGAICLVISLIAFFVSNQIYNQKVQAWYNNSVNTLSPYGTTSTNIPQSHSYIYLTLAWISGAAALCGVVLLVISYRRELLAYKINTYAPIASEVNKKYARPFIINSGKTFGKMYKNFKDEVNNTNDNSTIVCPVCNASINKDSKFCSECGSKLKEE